MTALEKSLWQILRSPGFSGGLNREASGEDVEPNELTDAKNVRYFGGYLRSVPGYVAFADAFRGSAQIIARVTFQDATSETLLLTTVTFYKLVGSQWQYVSNGTSTTTTGAEATGQTLIGVADRTGLGVGDHVGIILTDGTQHKTTITGTGAG